MIENCSECQRKRDSQQRQPLQQQPLPSVPMHTVGVDLCDAAGATWLVMVDRYSGYTFAQKLRSTSTDAITKVMHAWFAEYGHPMIIKSDNGPQFRGPFTAFCCSINAVQELSSPYNPASNGLAEAAVKNVKRIIVKCARTNADFPSAHAEFRNTPRADGFSPAQMFFGWRQRHSLPTLPSHHLPIDRQAAVAAREARAAANKSYVDAHSAPLDLLPIGTNVQLQNPLTNTWETRGFIKDIRASGQSYTVQVDGRDYVRNRKFLKPTTLPLFPSQPLPAALPPPQFFQTSVAPPIAPRRSARIASRLPNPTASTCASLPPALNAPPNAPNASAAPSATRTSTRMTAPPARTTRAGFT